MIEYQTNPTKRLIFKAVAVLLIAAFVWYDISWAADLFYTNITPIGQTAPVNHDKAAKQAKEITNYDKLSYETQESIARKLLPSERNLINPINLPRTISKISNRSMRT